MNLDQAKEEVAIKHGYENWTTLLIKIPDSGWYKYYEEAGNLVISSKDTELSDYKEAHESKQELVREIGKILDGENAAKQPSLCDLVGPIRDLKSELEQAKKEIEVLNDRYNKLNHSYNALDEVYRQETRICRRQSKDIEELKAILNSNSPEVMKFLNKNTKDKILLNSEIDRLKKEIESLKKERDKLKSMQPHGAEFEKLIRKSNDYNNLQAELDRLKGEIRQLKGFRKCNDCETEFKSDGRCPECNPLG